MDMLIRYTDQAGARYEAVDLYALSADDLRAAVWDFEPIGLVKIVRQVTEADSTSCSRIVIMPDADMTEYGPAAS